MTDLAREVEAWSIARRNLFEWQKEHLLVEKPDPEMLALNKKALDRMIFHGQVFSLATSRGDFPDRALADEVHANLWALRELYQMFHDPMEPAEADRILAQVFPDEP